MDKIWVECGLLILLMFDYQVFEFQFNDFMTLDDAKPRNVPSTRPFG